jgi:hypothetical protein
MAVLSVHESENIEAAGRHSLIATFGGFEFNQRSDNAHKVSRKFLRFSFPRLHSLT